MQEKITLFFQEHASPFLDAFFNAVTILGEQYFYILVITFTFWNLSKKQGVILSFTLAFSMLINNILKIAVRAERPFEVLDNVEAQRVQTATGYSFPSGHTQGAGTFFTTAAILVKKWWFTIIALSVAVLIAISRVYLGVHWFVDVVAGLAIGIVTSLIFAWYIDKIFEEKKKLYGFLVIILVFTLLAVFGVVIINDEMFGNSLKVDDFYKRAGTVIGSVLGFIWQEVSFPFSTKGDVGQKFMRWAIGIAGTIGIMIGLKYVFPENILFDSLRYCIVGLWITAFYPFLGILLGMFRKQKKEL